MNTLTKITSNMAVMVMEEDLEVVILEISLVMGRKRKI